ncbi:uncharacterized protein PAC_14183 [Phialocephala subalpina]|uniref:Uncharacterized protein n=1 Tax=Phialocephala subalpina TaxID=576137 RepID=A0A1L7XGV4_9HELO|nr:uncharacterized protein PAC_14183 [Phialocephala subalpina]
MADLVVPLVGSVSALLTAGALQYSFADKFKTKKQPAEQEQPTEQEQATEPNQLTEQKSLDPIPFTSYFGELPRGEIDPNMAYTFYYGVPSIEEFYGSLSVLSEDKRSRYKQMTVDLLPSSEGETPRQTERMSLDDFIQRHSRGELDKSLRHVVRPNIPSPPSVKEGNSESESVENTPASENKISVSDSSAEDAKLSSKENSFDWKDLIRQLKESRHQLEEDLLNLLEAKEPNGASQDSVPPTEEANEEFGGMKFWDPTPKYQGSWAIPDTWAEHPTLEDSNPELAAFFYVLRSAKIVKPNFVSLEESALHWKDLDAIHDGYNTLPGEAVGYCKEILSKRYHIEIPEIPFTSTFETTNETISSPTASPQSVPQFNSFKFLLPVLLVYLLAVFFALRISGRVLRKQKARKQQKKKQQPKTDVQETKTHTPAPKSPKTRGQQVFHTLTIVNDWCDKKEDQFFWDNVEPIIQRCILRTRDHVKAIKTRYENSCDCIETLFREKRLKRSSDEKCCDRLPIAQAEIERCIKIMHAQTDELKLATDEKLQAYINLSNCHNAMAKRDIDAERVKTEARESIAQIQELNKTIAEKDEEMKRVKAEALVANEKATKLNETMMQIAKKMKVIQDSRTPKVPTTEETQKKIGPQDMFAKMGIPVSLPPKEQVINPRMPRDLVNEAALDRAFESCHAGRTPSKPIKKSYTSIHQNMIEVSRMLKTTESSKEYLTKPIASSKAPSKSQASANPKIPVPTDPTFLQWQEEFILDGQARKADAEEAAEEEKKKSLMQREREARDRELKKDYGSFGPIHRAPAPALAPGLKRKATPLTKLLVGTIEKDRAVDPQVFTTRLQYPSKPALKRAELEKKAAKAAVQGLKINEHPSEMSAPKNIASDAEQNVRYKAGEEALKQASNEAAYNANVEEKLRRLTAGYQRKLAFKELSAALASQHQAAQAPTPITAANPQQHRMQLKMPQISNSDSSSAPKTRRVVVTEKKIINAANVTTSSRSDYPLVANFARNNALRDYHVQMNILAEQQRRTEISRGKQAEPAAVQPSPPKQDCQEPTIQDQQEMKTVTTALCGQDSVKRYHEAWVRNLQKAQQNQQREFEKREKEEEAKEIAFEAADEDAVVVVEKEEETASYTVSTEIAGEEAIVVDKKEGELEDLPTESAGEEEIVVEIKEQQDNDVSSISSSDGSDWEELEAPDSFDDF